MIDGSNQILSLLDFCELALHARFTELRAPDWGSKELNAAARCSFDVVGE